MEDSKTTAVAGIGIALSTGAMFMIASFLVPGISLRYQILCWETAMVAFFAAALIVHKLLYHPIPPAQHHPKLD